MLRMGSRDSSPYSAADSKPTKLTNANINPIPSDPDKTFDGANADVGNAPPPWWAIPARSNTTRMANSATTRVPRTLAERSAERNPSRPTTPMATAEYNDHGSTIPALRSTRSVKYPKPPARPHASAV